jgi:hypothetical protein
MHRKSQLHNRIILLICVATSALFFQSGCAPSGMVIDKSEFQTPVKHLYLKEEPFLKVWHGGLIQHIPLSKVQMVKINAVSSMVIGDELFYSGEVIFKNGAKIQSAVDKTQLNPVFISIHNTLAGKSKEQSFTISLENVTQIQIKK